MSLDSTDKIVEQPEKRLDYSFFCPGVPLSSERQKKIGFSVVNYVIAGIDFKIIVLITKLLNCSFISI